MGKSLKIKGEELHLWVGSGSTAKTIALATNTTIEISSETDSISTKDDATSGMLWSNASVKSLSWTASSESMFCVNASSDEGGCVYSDLYGSMVNGSEVSITFGKKSNAAIGANGWTKDDFLFSGNAIITSLSLNASNGDYSTYSVSFQGVGALTKNE